MSVQIQILTRADVEEIVAEHVRVAIQSSEMKLRTELFKTKKGLEGSSITPESPVTALGLSDRVLNILRNIEIITVDQLCQRTESEMMHYNHFGKWCLRDVKLRLYAAGLNLKGSD